MSSSPVHLPTFSAPSPESTTLFNNSKCQTTTATTLPSPPLSVASDTNLLDFDPADLTFDVGNTPESTALVSPKSASPGISPIAGSVTSSFTFEPLATAPSNNAAVNPNGNTNNSGATTAAEALCQHHLERYLHYKALAAQAEAVSLSLIHPGLMAGSDTNNTDAIKANNMLAMQSQPAIFNGHGNATTQGFWSSTLQYQQQQTQAAAHQQALQAQAQAQAHLQAHAAAAAQRTMSMGTYFMPPSSQQQQTSTEVPQQQQPSSLWSRQSVSTSVSGASPPFPSTPIYTSAPGLPMAMPTIKGADDMDMEEDELSSDGKSQSPANGVTNLHGGGRGYIPGKTPDDPRKRHKCTICGRGFARAFNLKSHIQTHDPARPKPHQCPHPMCKRSFSRLHDLERHRQGIHSDGPLVDAKRQGVSPSIIRAQSRMRSRAESGGLI